MVSKEQISRRRILSRYLKDSSDKQSYGMVWDIESDKYCVLGMMYKLMLEYKTEAQGSIDKEDDEEVKDLLIQSLHSATDSTIGNFYGLEAYPIKNPEISWMKLNDKHKTPFNLFSVLITELNERDESSIDFSELPKELKNFLEREL